MTDADQSPVDGLQALIDGLLAGETLALSRSISHIENRESGYRQAMTVIEEHTGNARKIGITGPPGAGKSTLVDQLVTSYREQDLTVGVVAVDPASPYSGGSILGDRIRQRALVDDDDVFFRSMSARNHTGGIAPATLDTIHALDAFGKDIIILETVGSGQSEVDVIKAADSVCVVLMPGAGDDIQANKAGLLEIADVFIVNKADLDGVDSTVNSLREMLELGNPNDWVPPIETTVAVEGEGTQSLVETLEDHWQHLQEDDRLSQRRDAQFTHEVGLYAREQLLIELEAIMKSNDVHSEQSPHQAASELLGQFCLRDS
jgi:LAO/AO transport system kinase